jgi:HEAT repeat protein
LVKTGKDMTPYILKAISDQDMIGRSKAIGALWHIKNRRAISSLEKILKDKSEKDYFRGDALEAIYAIDSDLGTKYAKEFKSLGNY